MIAQTPAKPCNCIKGRVDAPVHQPMAHGINWPIAHSLPPLIGPRLQPHGFLSLALTGPTSTILHFSHSGFQRLSFPPTLPAAIQNKYGRDPDKLAAWKSASLSERAAKMQKPDDTTPSPTF